MHIYSVFEDFKVSFGVIPIHAVLANVLRPYFTGLGKLLFVHTLYRLEVGLNPVFVADPLLSTKKHLPTNLTWDIPQLNKTISKQSRNISN